MEGVWPKAEPTDDSFDDHFSIKLEQGIAEPLTIIHEGVYIEPNNEASEEVEIDPIRKCKIKKSVKQTATKPKKKQNAEKISPACDECGKEFTRASSLNRHKLLHLGLRPYVCPVENCGAAFSQSSGLKSHEILHTGVKRERNFFCEECGQGFLSKFYMRIHQRSKHSGERPYVCKECGQGFTRKQNLTRHELEHRGEKPFKCDDCGMEFYEKILLKSHKKTHTVDGKPFTCAECGKGFYHKTSLNAHQRNHASVRQFACEICGKRFTQKGTLTIHKMIHSDVKPFTCEECGLQFTQKFTLKTHRLKQHGLSTTSEKLYKPRFSVPATDPNIQNKQNDCIQLSQTTKISAPMSTNSSQQNKSTVLEERAYVAESNFSVHQPEGTSEASSSDDEFTPKTDNVQSTEFEYKFAVNHCYDSQEPESIALPTNQIKEEPPLIESDIDWKSERTTPDNEFMNEVEMPIKQEFAEKNPLDESDRLPCGKCDRTFALIGALRNHQRSHNRHQKERKMLSFICDVCGKKIAGKQHLKTHMRIHTGSLPYACSQCNKKFTQPGNLKTHEATHTDILIRERPFACEICGMTFPLKNTLDKHQRTHSDERNFECDVCHKRFKHSGSINRHKLIHSGERNYGCDICGKTFIDKGYIKFHLRTHTGYKPFACDECPSTFIDKSGLTQHKGYSHRRVGEPSPYKRRKLTKMMQMMNNSM